MTVEPEKGEEEITLLADSGMRERCLRFPKGAVPGKKVDRLLAVRGNGGRAVVRGCRCGTAPTDSAVLAAPALVKRVTGSDSTNELRAVIAEASWIASLPEFTWQSWGQVIGALTTFGAVVLALVVTFVSSEASSGLLVCSLVVGCLAAAITLVVTVVKALTISCD